MSRFIIGFLGIMLLPKAAELLAPFILGLLIYFLCCRSVRRMAALGMHRGAAAFFALSFVAVIALGITAAIVTLAYNETGRLPELYARLSSIEIQSTLLKKFLAAFSEELTEAARTITIAVLSRLGDVTGFLMVLLFALLSAFFFLKDEDKIVDIIQHNRGDGFIKNALMFRDTVSVALSGYIRAQLLLMLLTFAILSVFLLLFRVRYALLAALGTAFLDALPVFGTGFILLPWALYEFLTGSSALGFGLVALYGVCSLTRQILEPKILSSQIGLHPLLTLAGVFAGFKLFGVLGLIAGPLLVLAFVTYIQKYK